VHDFVVTTDVGIVRTNINARQAHSNNYYFYVD